MRYLFSALLVVFILLLVGQANSTELGDPFCDNPGWAIETPQTDVGTAGASLPEALNLLITNNLALPLDERTSLALNYGLFSLPDQDLQRGLRVVGPSFSIGLRCLFD